MEIFICPGLSFGQIGQYLNVIMLYEPEYEVEIKLINEEIKDQEQTLGRIKRRNVATDMSPRCPF